jgi:Fur family peroxide stress response transcriptional regulator
MVQLSFEGRGAVGFLLLHFTSRRRKCKSNAGLPNLAALASYSYMSLTESASLPVCSREQDLRHALEEAGWRCTRQRAAVFAYLRSVDCHPTAEQIFAAVRRQLPHISLATIYKALDALVDARLATRFSGGPGPARYDGRTESHYHLRCQRTGQVRDVPMPYDPQLLDKLAPQLAAALRQQGFEITGHRLELVGHFTSSP